MTPVQPILIVLLVGGALLFALRLRSPLVERLIVFFVFSAALLLVVDPDLATHLAKLVGVGRGADLVFYIAIPGLGFLVLVLFSRIRTLSLKLTLLVREQALAQVTDQQSKRLPAK